MTRIDRGEPTITDVGLSGSEARGWAAIAEASRPQVRDVPEPTKSALDTFDEKGQAKARKAQIERILAKDANARTASENAYLAEHHGEEDAR